MNPTEPHTPPSIASLMGRYLVSRQEALIEDADLSEVEPHDAATGFRAAIQTTWAETTAVFRLLGLKAEKLTAPPDWSAFVNQDELAIPPMAAGFVPQRIRQHTQLLGLSGNFGPRITNLAGLAGLRGWIRKCQAGQSVTQLLVAAGLATALGDFEEAEACLKAAQPLCDATWKVALQNQEAALHWRMGNYEAARAIWSQLTHDGIGHFNLGLAHWQLGNKTEAAELLNKAADLLPEHSGWSHLARLYSTLAAV